MIQKRAAEWRVWNVPPHPLCKCKAKRSQRFWACARQLSTWACVRRCRRTFLRACSSGSFLPTTGLVCVIHCISGLGAWPYAQEVSYNEFWNCYCVNGACDTASFCVPSSSWAQSWEASCSHQREMGHIFLICLEPLGSSPSYEMSKTLSGPFFFSIAFYSTRVGVQQDLIDSPSHANLKKWSDHTGPISKNVMAVCRCKSFF